MAPTLASTNWTEVISRTSIAQIAVVLGGILVVYSTIGKLYSVYFGPLSQFPGSKLHAFSYVFFSRRWISGRTHHESKALHDKYGSIVRTGPNQLSFATATSWKEIYGHNVHRKPFLKSDFYSDTREANVAGQRDPIKHSKQRRLLANAFSAKSLNEQEEIVHSYIDLLMKQIGKYATGKEGTEMVKWYNWCTFDIIGDLAFGEPFGSLQDAEPHYWVSTIFDFMRGITYFSSLRFWGITNVPHRLLPDFINKARERQFRYSLEKTKRRMQSKTTRKDFMSKILQEKEAQNISDDLLAQEASVLILAGSETTATTLSGFSYYICKNQQAYKKLTDEIRSSFKSYEDIVHHKAEHLPYLKAVIDECLRIYPPVPWGLPRYSPGEYVDGFWIPEGTELWTDSWSTTRSEQNFHRPNEFIPERWLDPACTDKKDASQPFSLGSRVCLGRNLALLELRLIISKMLYLYDVELMDQNLDWDRDNKVYTLFIKPALQLKFTPRPGIALPSNITA